MLPFLLLVLVCDLCIAMLAGVTLRDYGDPRSRDRNSGASAFLMVSIVILLTVVLVAGMAHQMK